MPERMVMNIKETPWETRNLGVESSIEFWFDSADNADDELFVREVFGNTEFSYQVAHVPAGKIKIVNKLLNDNFWFSEAKIVLTRDLKNIVLPKILERFCQEMSYHQANTKEIRKIYHSMKNGIFATDKVALDPHFNAEIAGKRYVYWTQDEIAAGRAYVYVVTRADMDIGFFVLKRTNERVGDSFLAALFDQKRDSGLGFSVLYFPLVEAKRLGFGKIVTGVSLNNPDSLKIHMALGYQIKNAYYTLVKHVEKEGIIDEQGRDIQQT